MANNLNELISHLKQLESDFEELMKLQASFYKARAILWANLGKLKKHKVDGLTYEQYSSKSRRMARKVIGKGRGQVDHLVSTSTLFALNIPLVHSYDIRNLKRISKKDNKRKSFKSDWEVFKLVYLPLLKKEQK